MSAAPAISIQDVALAYRIRRDPVRSIKEQAIRRVLGRVRHEDHWALQDVSLEVGVGEVLAVIGANGAGKSTLLGLAAGVLPPTRGRVVVRGRVAPILELGAGFHGDLTGYENIRLYGALLGLDPAELGRRAHEIAAWAGVADYLDVPVRAYSSGMIVRLAFAIATERDPEVLLIDEILTVGDQAFAHRSADRMRELIDRGSSALVVTHDLDLAGQLADRVIWLRAGRIAAAGRPGDVIDRYREHADEQMVIGPRPADA